MEKYVVVMLAGMAKELGGKAITMMLSVGNFSKRCDWPQMDPIAGYNESELTSSTSVVYLLLQSHNKN